MKNFRFVIIYLKRGSDKLKIFKKFIPQIAIVLILCVVSSFGLIKGSTEAGDIKPEGIKTVIIDPGHGEFDGGAEAIDGTNEKDINLFISQKVRDMLTLMGYRVIMTREDDNAVDDIKGERISKRKKSDMVNRLSLINSEKDAICVSIHLNKFTTSIPNGAQVFYGVKHENSYILANCIQESIKNHLQNSNERVVKKGTKSTYLLYNAEIPMVITECGFISNSEELSKLKTNEYQTKMAVAITAGINDYFNVL